MAVWTLLKETAGNWSSHKDARLGAALAYYSIFSIGPFDRHCHRHRRACLRP